VIVTRAVPTLPPLSVAPRVMTWVPAASPAASTVVPPRLLARPSKMGAARWLLVHTTCSASGASLSSLTEPVRVSASPAATTAPSAGSSMLTTGAALVALTEVSLSFVPLEPVSPPLQAATARLRRTATNDEVAR